jgi:hypothetical protein
MELRNMVDSHVGRGLQQRLEVANHIGGEQLALQISGNWRARAQCAGRATGSE